MHVKEKYLQLSVLKLVAVWVLECVGWDGITPAVLSRLQIYIIFQCKLQVSVTHCNHKYGWPKLLLDRIADRITSCHAPFTRNV